MLQEFNRQIINHAMDEVEKTQLKRYIGFWF